MLEIIMLIIGFVIIIKSADLLVDCASSLAIKMNIPKMLIALTIVSFGTCAPEIAIAFQSIASKNGDIAFANIIGSCVVNVFLIILPILLLITTVFSILMIDSLFNPATPNDFSRADGIVLILLFFIFVLYLFQLIKKRDKKEIEEVNIKFENSFIAILLLIVSLALITFSSDLIVNSATSLATKLNISDKIITMVLIAIGTSLPEMITTVASAKKGEFDIAIGNIIGTNIFNICIVLGLPISIYGGIGLQGFNLIDIIAIFASSFVLYIFAKSDNEISRKEGIAMVSIFIAYYAYLLL